MSVKNLQDTKFSKASFFDLDGTLLSGNGSFSFGIYLLKKRKISLKKFFPLLWMFIQHKRGKFSIEELHVQTFQKFFKYQNVDLFKDLARDFVDTSSERLINRVVFQELLESKNRGELTVILSSSPEFLVEAFAQRWEVDLWRGTSYQTQKKLWVAVDKILEGKAKSIYLIETCQKLEFARENSVAYSDHHNDLPFLEAAGEAIAVNPTKQLKEASIKKRWKVIRRANRFNRLFNVFSLD